MLPEPEEPEVFRLTQSASIHVLGAALGCSVGLLLAALRLPVPASVVIVGSLAVAYARLRARTVVTLTRRRLHVARAWSRETVMLDEILDVRLEKDLWSANLAVETRERTLRVRDVRDPAGSVAVIQSLVRHADDPPETPVAWRDLRAPDPKEQAALESGVGAMLAHRQPIPAFLAPGARGEQEALRIKAGRKGGVRPIDLGFLDGFSSRR